MSGKVTFGDLPTPTYVVAADLLDRKPKVWSTANTPDDSVAFAVRASCSIPVFFQPVQEGTTFYVDGGTLSNLPLFVFDEDTGDNKYHYERVLAFTLSSSINRSPPKDSFDYLMQLVDLSIEGATNLQKSLQPRVSIIDVDTGAISATDFDKMTDDAAATLVKNGKHSAAGFFANEHIHIAGRSYLQDEVWDEHQAYYAIVERAASVKDQVVVSDIGTKWFWQLFPTILGWKRRKIDVCCLHTASGGDEGRAARERQRRAYLLGLGVRVIDVEQLTFRGVVFDGFDDSDSYAVISSDRDNDYLPWASIYRGQTDRIAVKAIYDQISQHLTAETPIDFVPTIERCDPEEIIAILKSNIVQYRPESVELSYEEVPLEEVLLLSRYVRGFRLRQLSNLVSAFESHQIEPFSPAKVLLTTGEGSIVTPPVFEAVGRRFVAIEGNTRSFLSFAESKSHIGGIVARNVSESLPGKPLPVSNVRIATSKLAPHERMVGFDHSLFRPIERATHPLQRSEPE